MHMSAIVVFAAAAVVSAQSPIPTSTDDAFEVASVRPNKSGETSSSTSGRPGQFVATNVSVRRLIIYAYRLREFQIAGGPGWIGSDRFDIVARPPANATADNPAMTRALLRDRFKLIAHTETRSDQVYALVLARADGRLGPRIKTSTLNCAPAKPGASGPCGMNSSVNNTSGKMTGTGQSMANLVAALGSFGLSRMVLDRTGLEGIFDFELEWTPENARGAAGAQANDAPSIFAGLQEQLGLKVESQRGPVEFLVVDRIEQPTPD